MNLDKRKLIKKNNTIIIDLLTLGKYEYGYGYINKFFFFLFKSIELINKSRYGTYKISRYRD